MVPVETDIARNTIFRMQISLAVYGFGDIISSVMSGEALMSYSQRLSILSLLFQKGDPLCLDNYRPISLLNVDLKLISRLKKVLPNIINVDQTGYVKNRFIGFNLRQIQDIIDYADIYKIERAIIFIDFTRLLILWNGISC